MSAPAESDTSFLGRFARRFDDEANYTHDPVAWGQEKLNRTYTAQQQSVMRSVVENRYTAVRSAHELGKTLSGADLVAWWIDSHPPGEAFVVSTAPSAAQVSAVLWREIGKNHRTANLDGKINRAGYPQWLIGNELVGYGRKPADYEDSAFQGIHARYVLVVVDEAGGVAQSLYNAIDSIVANENSRVLAIGNPDDAGSYFAEICKPDSTWNVIHFDGLRSANMTRAKIIGDNPDAPKYPLTAALMEAEQIPYNTEEIPHLVREVLLDPLWVEERLREWCGVPHDAPATMNHHDLCELVQRRASVSALFQAKVRGVFPSQSAEGVIPLGWVEMAMARWSDWHDAGSDTSKVPDPSRHVIGVDVARFGEDETVIAPRFGTCITELLRYRQADTTETTNFAAAHCHNPHTVAVIDVIGIGAGVFDLLRRYKHPEPPAWHTPLIDPTTSVIAFNAAASTKRTDKIGQFRFRNDRAAAWWRMREKLDPSKGSKLMLPNDERLKVELTSVKYEHLVGGIIKIESKDDIKKRLGRSTDSADAVIQAFWVDGLDMNSTGDPVNYTTDKREHEKFTYKDVSPIIESDLEGIPGSGAQRFSGAVMVPPPVTVGTFRGGPDPTAGWYDLDDSGGWQV